MAEVPQQDIVVPVGATFYLHASYLQAADPPESGTPIPLGSWRAEFSLHAHSNGDGTILAVTSDDDLTTATVDLEPGGESGLVLVRLAATFTATLAKAGYYWLRLVDPLDPTEVVWLLKGRLQLDKGEVEEGASQQQTVVISEGSTTTVLLSAGGPRGPEGLRGDPGPPGDAEVFTLPDATTTDKGIVRLAGDLTGTAEEPRVMDPPIDVILLFDNAIA